MVKTDIPYPKVPIKSCITFNNPHPKKWGFFLSVKNFSRDPGSGGISFASYSPLYDTCRTNIRRPGRWSSGK